MTIVVQSSPCAIISIYKILMSDIGPQLRVLISAKHLSITTSSLLCHLYLLFLHKNRQRQKRRRLQEIRYREQSFLSSIGSSLLQLHIHTHSFVCIRREKKITREYETRAKKLSQFTIYNQTFPYTFTFTLGTLNKSFQAVGKVPDNFRSKCIKIMRDTKNSMYM